MLDNRFKEFFEVIKKFDEYEYLLSIIMYCAAPTIAGHKASSLINFNQYNRNLRSIWHKYKDKVIVNSNVYFYELKSDNKNTIVLVYNKYMLKQSLGNDKNMEFLSKYGYNATMNLEQCLTYLRERFQCLCPHEVGVFLGYPLEDVIAYVEAPTASCKVIGYWKVYHNETAARSVFNKFNALKYQVISRIIEGENPKEILRNSCKAIDLLSCLVDSTGVSF